MADGILGLGSTGSVDLNQDLIDKLKEAETTATVDPISTRIEDQQAEIDAVDEITTKITELLDIVEGFDLYTSGTNVFDEVTATTSGTSASFDATDTSTIKPGTIAVTIDQLAKKDVFQSNIIADETATMPDGTLSITVGDSTYDFNTTGLTYEELVTQINYNADLDASLEQVGDNSYRMIIKGAQSGLENAVSISQTGFDLGFEDAANHVVTSQNMLATIDGIDYDLSSNKVTLSNGLIITAVEEGDSSISIEKDDSYVVQQIDSMATAYNELVQLVNSYTIGDEDEPALISDSSTLRGIMSDIKSMFYDSYGLNDEENAFVYGISFDEDGLMQIDSAELSEAITNNYDDLKELFVGYAEKEGIGTRLSTYLDDLDGLDGNLTTYSDRLSSRLDELNDSFDQETERIDNRYQSMASQFAEYTVIITQMQNAFASLQLIMDQNSNN